MLRLLKFVSIFLLTASLGAQESTVILISKTDASDQENNQVKNETGWSITFPKTQETAVQRFVNTHGNEMRSEQLFFLKHALEN